MIGILQELGAAEMIVVAVRKDEVFHPRRIEAQFLVAADNDPLRFLGIIQAVDLDDAIAGHERP
jgi:hypothetical protein